MRVFHFQNHSRSRHVRTCSQSNPSSSIFSSRYLRPNLNNCNSRVERLLGTSCARRIIFETLYSASPVLQLTVSHCRSLLGATTFTCLYPQIMYQAPQPMHANGAWLFVASFRLAGHPARPAIFLTHPSINLRATSLHHLAHCRDHESSLPRFLYYRDRKSVV